MKLKITHGNLLDQDVDVIVNSWNRNLIPWWLLLPAGVSGAIKNRAGFQPFIELRKHGMLPLGGAVLTSAGILPHQGIIHVAGIGHTWTANETSIRLSVQNALRLAGENGFTSIALPLIGAGTGGMESHDVERIMADEIEASTFAGEVRIVIFQNEVMGEVIATGKGKIKDDGIVLATDVKKGDKILFGKYSGTEVKIEDEEFLILREDDILGVIEK